MLSSSPFTITADLSAYWLPSMLQAATPAAGTLEEPARRSWRREATASLEKGTCVIVTDFGERRIVGSMPPPRPTPASESDCDDRRGERAVMGMAETSEFRGVAWHVVVAVPFEKRRD